MYIVCMFATDVSIKFISVANNNMCAPKPFNFDNNVGEEQDTLS